MIVVDNERTRDPDGIFEVAVDFKRALTSDDAVRILGFLISGLNGLQKRPYLRMRWEADRITLLRITGSGGEIRLRQHVAALVSDLLYETSIRVVRRFDLSAPLRPATRFLRIAYLRRQFAEEGPHSQSVPHVDEVVTILIEMSELFGWFDDPGVVSSMLANELQGKPDQFHLLAWEQPVAPYPQRGSDV